MEKKEIAVTTSFTNEIILDQVQRILKYPAFNVSGVLSSFLSYVVHETLSGKAEYLKEYTIAVNVFNKPLGFNPSQSGIVRVNARRLRDALSEYYMNCKAENACEIIIPKGGYTPVFKKFRSSHAPPLQSGNKNSSDPDETIKIAVMPFKSWERVQLKLSVIDSVGQMLSNEFSKSPYFSVLSHYTTRQLQSENASIHDMHSRYGIQIAVTGSILINPKRITVFLQLVKAETAMLVWSDRLDMDIALSRNPNVIQLIANEIMRTIPPLSNFLVRQGSGKVARLKILPVSKIYTDNTA